ncbi:hypothetical protein M8494_27345 [Serratia ureilytica]
MQATLTEGLSATASLHRRGERAMAVIRLADGGERRSAPRCERPQAGDR